MASRTVTAPIDIEDEVVLDTTPMSYEEYQAWYDEGRRGEWVDGEVIPFMATSERHGRIHSILFGLLVAYLDLRRLGRVYTQTFELRSREGAAREPDILVVLNQHRDRIEEMRVRGAADLVVEIISPDSVTRDRKVKFDEYEAAGVPEYWIIDPRRAREAIDVYVLGADGAYAEAELDDEGRLRSVVLPGVWFDPAWLIGDELPAIVRLAMEMAGEA